MKPHEFYLDIDFWEDHCNLVWPVTKESAEKWYKEKFPEKDPEDFPQLNDARAISYCGDVRIIFIKDWQMSVDNISYLCHECVHIANHILLDKGVKEKRGCDETLAYFVGYLMRNFLEAIKQIEANPSGGEQAVGG